MLVKKLLIDHLPSIYMVDIIFGSNVTNERLYIYLNILYHTASIFPESYSFLDWIQ